MSARVSFLPSNHPCEWTRAAAEGAPALARLQELDALVIELAWLMQHRDDCAVLMPLVESIASRTASEVVYSEYAVERREREPKKRPAPTNTDRFARGVLRNALGRIAADTALLATETRTLVRFVEAGNLDGRLVRVALVDAAFAGGLASEAAEQIIRSVAAAHRA